MAINQVDQELRLPYEPASTGYYYWTNTYFYNTADQPSDNPSYYWVSVGTEQSTLTVTQRTALKVTSPPGSGIYVLGAPSIPLNGALTFTGGWSPHDIGRLSFWASEKIVGYKLWRMPIPSEEISGDGVLSSWAIDAMNNFAGYLLHAKITTRDGTPIDAITVSPRVHQWSYRHDTKRRDRRVLVFP
jgi:hypothetical protein